MIIIASFSFAIKNWKTYTNTTHIFDVESVGNDLYLATWGGMLTFDLNDLTFKKNYTIIDGLSGTDIRALNYSELSEMLLIGTHKNGVNRFSDEDFFIPITETIGLASDKIKNIVQKDSLIFITTIEGLSVFSEDPDFPFPFLVDNYSSNNGLSADLINSIRISDDNYLFCGSETGLDYVHIDSMNTISAWHNLNINNSLLPGNNVSSISIRNDKIAIGTNEGIALTNLPALDSWTIYNESNLPDTNGVFPVYLDADQNLWFSFGEWNDESLDIDNSSNISVYKISPDGSEQFWMENEDEIQDSLTTSKVTGFAEIDGKFIAYTWGESFFILDNENWINYKPNSIPANIVTDVEVDKNGKVWVANGYYGLWELSKGTKGVSCLIDDNWEFYTSEEYPQLKTNNVMDITVDSNNKKWFSCWQLNVGGNGGISYFNDQNGEWSIVDGLSSSYFTSTYNDDNGNMWINSYNFVNVIDQDMNIDEIQTPYIEGESHYDRYISSSLIADNRSYFGYNAYGLDIWDDPSVPDTVGIYWEKTPFSDLRSGKVYEMIKHDYYNQEQVWIASSNGLFMFDGEYWYKYGTVIKKKVYKFGYWYYQDNDPEYLYYVDQERLFGSKLTYPTALYADPFNRIWIGTEENGITVFDLDNDKFINLNMDNSNLLSNKITSFSYEPLAGTMYIGTNEGMNSVEIGITYEANYETQIYSTISYPNPFYPDRGDLLKIENTSSLTMPKGETFCHIYDLSGELIIKLNKDIYQQFSWNGKNEMDKKCSSGLYFYLVSTPEGQIARGKFALIR